MSLLEDTTNSTITIALGNPANSRELRKGKRDEGELVMGTWMVEPCDIEPGDPETGSAGITMFWYKADAERYESGYLIIVSYEWNNQEDYCVENDILRPRTHLDIEVFREKILNIIKDLRSVTLLQIKTVKGSLRVRELKREVPDAMAYPPIPDSLSAIPHVPISTLRKCPVDTDYHHIDIVTRDDDPGPCQQWYVFKRYGIPLEEQERPMENLLSEADLLCRVESPYIMKPSFIVTDNCHSLFRGYLMPFMPAGALGYVLDDLTTGSLNREPMFLHPRHLELCTCDGDGESEKHQRVDEPAPARPANPQLPWSIKHTWAIEATSALATLHENRIFSGDVKLPNILLDRDGHLQFIDVAPQPAYTYPYIAPELDLSCENHDVSLPLTEARDVFAFGIVLWQIAEEEAVVEDREDPSRAPNLIWRSNDIQGSTPPWYQKLVGLCIECDPLKRPSAKEILAVLESNQ